MLEPEPAYDEREIALRVDFTDLDDERLVWVSLRFMSGPRPPIPDDVVFMADGEGNSCFGRVEAVNGWVARVEPDWTTWSGATGLPAAAGITPVIQA
jgi:hypothetical protein